TSTSNINSTATPTASQLTSYSNGTNPATFTVYTKPQNIPFFNPFCDASKYGAACADPLTLSYIQAATEQIATNNIAETQLNLNGPIFDLPAGTVKLAVGAEYDNETFLNHRNTTNSAALGGTKVYTIDGVSRNYASFFEELYIPVIGGNFTLPGIQELDIATPPITSPASPATPRSASITHPLMA